MFAVFVTVDVHPDRIEQFRQAITTNAETSLRDESGCLAFDVHRDETDETRYYFYEVYADEDAFTNGHCRSAHYANWQEAAKTVVVDGGTKVVRAHPILFGSAGRQASPAKQYRTQSRD